MTDEDVKIVSVEAPPGLIASGEKLMEEIREDQKEKERQERLARRYQFQPFYVKAFRRIKHFPLYAHRVAHFYLTGFVSGFKIPEGEVEWFNTKKKYRKHILTMFHSLYAMDCEHYWTMEEVMGDCRRESEAILDGKTTRA